MPERKPEPPATMAAISREELAQEFVAWVYVQSINLQPEKPRRARRKKAQEAGAPAENLPPASLTTTSDVSYQEQWRKYLKQQKVWENAIKHQ
jgi:hypothetical protein